MSNKPKEISRNFDYPVATEGSKAAKKLRSEANTFSDTERASLLEAGMQIIYGGNAKKAIGTRR